MQNLDMKNRMIFAFVLSFLFLIVYEQYIMPPQQTNTQSTTDSTKHSQAPDVSKTQVIGATNQIPNNAPVLDNSKPIILTVDTPKSIITIDSLGRVDQVTLKHKQFKTEDGTQVKLFKKFNILRPLDLRFSDTQINSEAYKSVYVSSNSKVVVTNTAQSVTLTQKLSNHTITKTITFFPDGHYDISVDTDIQSPFFITPGFRPDVAVDKFVFHGALVKEFDNTITTIDDEELEQGVRFTNAKIATSVDKYYATAFYNFKNGFRSLVIDTSKDNNPFIFVEGIKSLKVSGYMGAKSYKTLDTIDPQLTSIIEYGWFTFISKPLFQALMFLHGIFGNWGWSIVVITILLKVILFPLTFKGMMSMQKLKDLAPQVKELQEKHKGNPQKSSAAMMELYKRNNANPMGGCLPMILQIPVFFAIYRVLLNAMELQGAPWVMWITDMSVKDPYFVLPILMGATMFIQQSITPTTVTDPMQQKIFKWLPVVFTFFFMTFPAGLTLYWFVNNLFSVAQQYYINGAYEKAKELRKAQHDQKKHHHDKS